jgi:diguanylate cyclase (GGDEF)-like protein/PAS domain S-box-containing protein
MPDFPNLEMSHLTHLSKAWQQNFSDFIALFDERCPYPFDVPKYDGQGGTVPRSHASMYQGVARNKELMSQRIDFKALVEASPYPYVWLAPDLTIIGANEAFLRVAGRTRAELVGRHAFDAFPADPNDPQAASARELRASMARAIKTGKPDTVALLRYPIPRSTPHGALFDERYWSIVNTPVLDDQGAVAFLFQNPIDVTGLYSTNEALREVQVTRDHGQKEESVLFRSQSLVQANRRLDEELANLRRLFEQAPGFVCVFSGPDHVYEMANEAYYQLVGHRKLVGKPFREAIPEVEGQGYYELADRAYSTGQASVVREMRARVQREPDGPLAEIYIDMLVQPVFAPDGSVSGVFIQGHDVTDRKQAQDELRISNERWKLAIEGTGDGVWDWDIPANTVTYSPRWKEILGYAEHEISDSFSEWEKRVHPDDRSAARAGLQACLDGTTRAYVNEHRLLCKDGNWKWMLARAIVVARDDKQRPLRVTGMMTDITDKRESDEVIWRHANFDTLTGLPNRRLFRDRLDHEVKKAHRTGLPFAVLFIDLDRFKEANDLLGHDIGDVLLGQAAQRISGCVRGADTVARLGGDEFTVIVSELHNDTHVEEIAQKMLATLSDPFHLGDEIVHLSGSIGITLYPTDAATPEDLIRNADQAMYAAKNAGKNQFSYFTRAMQEKAYARLRLSGDLRHALRGGELEVYYQPVVALASDRVCKAEALLRWRHPTLGWVEPAKFIPIAEESGSINEIGDWVFEQAASCLRRWRVGLDIPLQIGINRSPVQFLSRSRQVNWSANLTQLGLSGDSISVEITEGLLLNTSASVAAELLEYRDAGIQVAIDDFGTGYSSMAYLKKFDIDYLKIDRSFVRDMVVDAGSRTIAESIIAMAHKLGLQVIAEGVETVEQRALLAAAGCDFAQGYLFSKPVPQDDFERLLTGALETIRHAGQ